ncbi:MAG TPA: toll/interleukin-1 receptor domain-containing protein [Thermoanaerobaculia bacterium]|nr:toll/interleukin-1 receptor domain-containing protein [Thermoanaerobaculia bacterium]
MRIFLSYASEQTREADLLKPKLVNEGHRVFFAPANLRSGDAYEKPIRKELRESDLLLFLISPESVQPGYALTELKSYEEFHPKSHGRVLPVVVKETELELIPGYLQAVTLLKPQGDMVAEVIKRVSEIAAERKRRVLFQALAVVVLAAIGAWSWVCGVLPRPYHALLLVPWTGIYDHLSAVSDPSGSPVTSLRVHFGKKLYTVTDLRQQTTCLAPAQQLARAIKDAQTRRWTKDVGALSGSPLTDQDQEILKALSHETPRPLKIEGMQGNETIEVGLVSSKDGKETVVDRFTMDGRRPGLQIHLLSLRGGTR